MTESVEALQQRVRDQAKAATARPIYRFTIPENLANGVTTVGLVQLTSAEELRATKRAQNDPYRLAYELAKQSLVEVNEQTVKEGDGSADRAWTAMTPKVRTLLLAAYGELHTPEQDEIADFLKSQAVSVG